jgi:hypothetical protein
VEKAFILHSSLQSSPNGRNGICAAGTLGDPKAAGRIQDFEESHITPHPSGKDGADLTFLST